MSFLHPGAFAGLASILILILLSFWRQRPARVVVPSVRLWERIPDRLPPVKALRRPRASVSLLLQMLVAAAIVTSMAGPGVVRERPAPRKIAVVLDVSASMMPRLDDMRRELAKLDPADDITMIESPTLIRRQGVGPFEILADRAGDPGPALDLAASEAKQIVFISDRTPAWTPPAGVKLNLALVGGPLRNVGIVDAGVENGKLFLRVSGAAGAVVVTIDGKDQWLGTDSFYLIDVPEKALRIEVQLGPPDGFEADDHVVLERTEARIDVGFEGRPDAAILAAIESNPRARVVRGGSPRLLIRIGEASGGASAPVMVHVDPKEGVKQWSPPGVISIEPHELTKGVEPEDLKLAEVGMAVAVRPLMYSDGVEFAGLRRGGEIVIAARYASTGWPARPSFPIFWANVIDYAAAGVGAWRAKGLLDEAASSPGHERKPFDPGALESRPLAPVRTDLTGGSVAIAALLLALLWFVEGRRNGAD